MGPESGKFRSGLSVSHGRCARQARRGDRKMNFSVIMTRKENGGHVRHRACDREGGQSGGCT